MAASTASASKPVLTVRPKEALTGEPWRVKITRLKPGTRATIRAASKDPSGTVWEARAVFEADSDGAIDLTQSASLSGSYRGADPAGMFWSARPVQGGPAPEGFAKSLDPQEITMSVEVKGVTVAARVIRRLVLPPGVEREPVRADGVVGTLFTPTEPGRRPALIVLGGSEGGAYEPTAAAYAGRGYTTLALAFFGMNGLPESLVNVPLETVERAIGWLAAHHRVRPAEIGIWGVSKGAELALLAASHFPQIKAVVAKSPSAVSFEGISEKMGQVHKPSWTYRGEPVPFVPVNFTIPSVVNLVLARLLRWRWSTAGLYSQALSNAEAAASAAIEVERINGPVLLTSGGRDGAWPSGRMAEMIMKRLGENGHPFPDVHLHYEDAGHQIVAPYSPTTINSVTGPFGLREDLGGSAEANAAASLDSWPQINDFLDKHLPADRSASKAASVRAPRQRTAARPGGEPGTTAGTKAAARPSPKPGTKAAAKPGPKPGTKAAAKPGTKAAAKPGTKAGTKPGPKAGAAAGTKTGTGRGRVS